MATATKPSPVQSEEVQREYFFPAYGKTITAASIEDAQSKLTTLLEKSSH